MLDLDEPSPDRVAEASADSGGEGARLAALDRYDILDTPNEESFDRVTRLSRRAFGVPIAAISLIDGHRQWFKSRHGLAGAETPRATAFCDHAIRRSDPMVVTDASLDPRFAQHSSVIGDPRIRFYAGVPLRTPDGHNIGTLCIADSKPRSFDADDLATLDDLARIVMDELELRTLATTDGLTGALARRAFRAEAARLLALALRHRHDLSCIMLDLDHFKRVNDAHGHGVGDKVLAATVQICRAELRGTDLIGRMGGEEFAVLLPHTPRAAAADVAEKLRAAIGRHRVAVPLGEVAISASLGIATLDRSTQDVDALLARADSALYEAKADGRDRCVAWAPAPPMLANVRRRVLKAGRITFNAGRSTIDCTVRSLSVAAAGLDVCSSAGIPGEFKLAIESDGLSRLCRVTEKRDKHIEVAFA